jgi:hypothetical protein
MQKKPLLTIFNYRFGEKLRIKTLKTANSLIIKSDEFEGIACLFHEFKEIGFGNNQ